MKFLTNKNFHQHSPVQVQDYIDTSVIESLPAQQKHLLNRIIYTDSKYLEKFFNKLSSNQVYLNADMLIKILEKLTNQMALPLRLLQHDKESSGLQYFALEDTPFTYQSEIWMQLLEDLNIWSNIPLDHISNYLQLAHQYISLDTFPPFNDKKNSQSRLFWQKKTDSQTIYTEVLFKFIYDKLRHFHWEYLPNTKRPMDLFELFCPLEDTALEKNIVVLNEEQTEFLRSLNASALIYSVVFSFSAALPDYIAHLSNMISPLNSPLWETIQEDEQFEPFYGQHPYLHALNRIGFYSTLKELIKKQHQTYDFFDALINQSNQIDRLEQFYTSQTSRLIFIFNRLTSLGFLMRSPLLKGLGYHPVINTETPAKFMNNFRLFLQAYQKLDEEKKQACIEQLEQVEDTHTLRINSPSIKI